jgi:hypothetical protein
MNNIEQTVSKLIGKTIGLYPNDVINILTKNGVVIDANALDLDKLILATFNGINTNPVFKSELAKFIDSKGIVVTDSEYSNIDAGTIIGGATSLFGSVTSYMGSKDQLKAAQTSANVALDSNKTALQIAQTNLQSTLAQAQIQAQASATKASNVPLYIGLGVGGVVIIGLMIFLITRKPK